MRLFFSSANTYAYTMISQQNLCEFYGSMRKRGKISVKTASSPASCALLSDKVGSFLGFSSNMVVDTLCARYYLMYILQSSDLNG